MCLPFSPDLQVCDLEYCFVRAFRTFVNSQKRKMLYFGLNSISLIAAFKSWNVEMTHSAPNVLTGTSE